MRPLDLILHFHVVKSVPSIKSNDFESEVWKVKTWFGWNQICNKEVACGLRDGGLVYDKVVRAAVMGVIRTN